MTSPTASGSKQPDALRTWLSTELIRQSTHCIYQEILTDTGVNTLVKLARIIRSECDLFVHIIGENPGRIPDPRFVPELFRFCDETGLRKRFPILFEDVADLKRWQHLTYTQWEAWLAYFFDRDIAVCGYNDDFSLLNTEIEILPMSMADHLQFGRSFFGRPTTCESRQDILIHVLKMTCDCQAATSPQFHTPNWSIQLTHGSSKIADRHVEAEHFRNLVSDKVPERVLLLIGPSNRGKSTLLEEFHAMLSVQPGVASATGNLKDGTSLRLLLLKLADDLSTVLIELRSLSLSTSKSDSRELWESFRQALSNTRVPIVLFLDTYEDATIECREWVEESLLPFIRSSDGVRLVVAGHSLPKPITPWDEICLQVDIGTIDVAKHWCQFRDRLGNQYPTDTEIEQFVSITGGDPSILNALIVGNLTKESQ